ncbi:MAG TPA: hypothetical protein VLT33_38725 [Labilithrix sp.]|nr:hypothetical protein [Labilithrix sp.]
MTVWRWLRRLVSTKVDAIVDDDRVFLTDSECLDDGREAVEQLFEPLGRIVAGDVRVERVKTAESERQWFVRFLAAGRPWDAWFAPRDYGAVFGLVNQALHHANATRRVHVVSSRNGGQDFYVACASVEEVAALLHAGWIVEPALPNVAHVIHHGGLRFFGDRPYRISARGAVIEAVLSEPQEVQGIPCAAGETVCFGDESDLESATLAEDVELGRSTIRAGSRVAFWNAAARLPCEVTLAGDHEIGGLPCAAGTSVTFREDGSLECVTLGRAHTTSESAGPYRGREIARGATVWLGQEGAIERVDESPEDTRTASPPFDVPRAERALRIVVDGITILGREDVELSRSGPEPYRLQRGTLAFDQTLEGLLCRGGTEIHLSDVGRVAQCTLARDASVGGIEVPSGASIVVEDGTITHVRLPADGDFLGADALAGVWLAVDASRRRVTRVCDELP